MPAARRWPLAAALLLALPPATPAQTTYQWNPPGGAASGGVWDTTTPNWQTFQFPAGQVQTPG